MKLPREHLFRSYCLSHSSVFSELSRGRWYTRLQAELQVGLEGASLSPFEMRGRRLVDRMALGLQV